MSISNAEKKAKALVDLAQQELNAAGARYDVFKVIGEGSYAVCFLAIHRDSNLQVAIKRVKPKALREAFLANRMLREIWMLLHFRDHPNIVQMLDLVRPVDQKSESFYIVMELMDHDLGKIMHSQRALDENQVRYFIYQTLCGLLHIHKGGVMHRDVTPANLLVNDDCTLKISDFGLAKEERRASELTDYVCQRHYRAPELVMQETNYTGEVDVWSCGCIFAQLCNGPTYRPLFMGEDGLRQLKAILEVIGTPSETDLQAIGSEKARDYVRRRHSNLPPVDWSRRLQMPPNGAPLPPKALDLVKRMLVFNPANRISVDEAMHHPYLSEFNVPGDEIDVTPFKIEDLVPLEGRNLADLSLEELKQLLFDSVDRIRHILHEDTPFPDLSPVDQEDAGALASGLLDMAPQAAPTATTTPLVRGQHHTSPVSPLNLTNGNGGPPPPTNPDEAPHKESVQEQAGEWSDASTEGDDLDEDDLDTPGT